MPTTCCPQQTFERHPDPKIADIGQAEGVELTIGHCIHCKTDLISCFVAGGVALNYEVVSKKQIQSFIEVRDTKERKKLLANWFNGLA